MIKHCANRYYQNIENCTNGYEVINILLYNVWKIRFLNETMMQGKGIYTYCVSIMYV